MSIRCTFKIYFKHMPHSIYISNKDVLEKDKIFFFFNQVLQLLKFQLIKITSYIIPPLNTHTCTKASKLAALRCCDETRDQICVFVTEVACVVAGAQGGHDGTHPLVRGPPAAILPSGVQVL